MGFLGRLKKRLFQKSDKNSIDSKSPPTTKNTSKTPEMTEDKFETSNQNGENSSNRSFEEARRSSLEQEKALTLVEANTFIHFLREFMEDLKQERDSYRTLSKDYLNELQGYRKTYGLLGEPKSPNVEEYSVNRITRDEGISVYYRDFLAVLQDGPLAYAEIAERMNITKGRAYGLVSECLKAKIGIEKIPQGRGRVMVGVKA